MFGRAIVCLVIAITAGLFGFGGLDSAAAPLARVLFVVSLLLFLVLLVLGRGPPHR